MTDKRTARLNNARLGMFIGDALAMPAHWYYDTWALRMDYGTISDYVAPRNPHPDSILWRSSYTPSAKKADILHDQAKYWGQRGIHYHQFLVAGENTLNLQLARELLLLIDRGDYSRKRWLETIVEFMTSSGRHQDTYVEEYLRHFFSRYGKNVPLEKCGRTDEKHIGGMSLLLPLLLCSNPLTAKSVLDHLALTHGGSFMLEGARLVIMVLNSLLEGRSLKEAIITMCRKDAPPYVRHDYGALSDFDDLTVVGRHFSSACYLDQAIPAVFFLAVKYADNPEEALIANTMCGGDNCGRGVLLGALLGAANNSPCWPERWRDGLRVPPPLLE